MNLIDFKKSSKLIRSSRVYDVYDNSNLTNLCLSLTELHANNHTGGHSHKEADEVYIFIQGMGNIQIGDILNPCSRGDVFLVPRGEFHKVFNTGERDLKFWSIFEKYGERR